MSLHETTQGISKFSPPLADLQMSVHSPNHLSSLVHLYFHHKIKNVCSTAGVKITVFLFHAREDKC